MGIFEELGIECNKNKRGKKEEKMEEMGMATKIGKNGVGCVLHA